MFLGLSVKWILEKRVDWGNLTHTTIDLIFNDDDEDVVFNWGDLSFHSKVLLQLFFLKVLKYNSDAILLGV
jgi:hypothetical protein